MRLRDWLSDKKVYFIIHTLLTLFILVFMNIFGMNMESSIFILIVIVIAHCIYLFYEYYRRYRFYKESNDIGNGLDQKYLVHELMEQPQFLEGEFIYDLIQKSNKAMNDVISEKNKEQKDYREYVETWVHEIKTPIASMYLSLENETYKEIEHDLKRIEAYVEQALYYAKSHHVEEDYQVKSVCLNNLISEVLRKKARWLIEKSCEVHFDFEKIYVKSDEKWLLFVLEQILNNAIQYSKEKMRLDFEVEKGTNNIVLFIRDHGVGIPKDELSHVFSKGYVGSGHQHEKKATGLGLYLVRALLIKLGHDVAIESELGKSTTVRITFPYSQHYS